MRISDWSSDVCSSDLGHRPLHLREEGRARMDARLAAQGVPDVAGDGDARLGQALDPADRLSGRLLLSRAQGEAQARLARRTCSRNTAHVRKADRKSVV